MAVVPSRLVVRGKMYPAGGDGGIGGDVIVEAREEVSRLSVQARVRAKDGGRGRKQRKDGKDGAHATILVPVGTQVSLLPTESRYPFPDAEPLADLDTDGSSIVVANGGSPGRGNAEQAMLSHTFYPHQKDEVLRGDDGTESTILLMLKVIADIGLVGFPNAGKSTLLGAVSESRPKVAAYPFTTLRPYVGRVNFSDSYQFRVCDIPGLVEGAHRNRGLGHSFLRHVERTKALVFVLDASAQCATENLRALMHELEVYSPELRHKPSLVVANKMDQVGEESSEDLITLDEILERSAGETCADDGSNEGKTDNFRNKAWERRINLFGGTPYSPRFLFSHTVVLLSTLLMKYTGWLWSAMKKGPAIRVSALLGGGLRQLVGEMRSLVEENEENVSA